jgi:sodium/calcium exchanger protein
VLLRRGALLLIDRTVVGTDTIEIQPVIPLHTVPTPVLKSVVGTKTAIRRLRSDGAFMTKRPQQLLSTLRTEWPLPVSLATTALFLMFGKEWLADLSNTGWFTLMLGWLFLAILVSAFAVVRHAEGLAVRLGEPFGTLVLTLSMSGMEMMMIAAVMYTGQGESSLARDTMLAIVMIVLNGLVGACLLLGGLRYHEQTYNLYGANAFLSVILPLAVLGLVLPRFTVSSPGPTFSPLQATFLILCRWVSMACSSRSRPGAIATISFHLTSWQLWQLRQIITMRTCMRGLRFGR